MYKELNKSAVSANSCDTMESGNHSKNGANPKSQMSRTVFTMSKFVFIGIAMLSFLAIGCDNNSNDDELPTETPTTVEEDKANIRASFDRTKDLLDNFKKGSFYRFADQFIDYSEEYKVEEETYDYYEWVGEGNGNYSYNVNTGEYDHTPGAGDHELRSNSYINGYYESSISEFTEMLGEKLQDVVDFDQIGNDGRFNYPAFTGQYVWNKSSSSWDKTSGNSILVLFPSSGDKTSNDCEAAITAYEDKQYDIEGEKIYLPTKANIYLKKDGETLFSTDLTADFSNYGIPKQIIANIYAKPLKFDVSLVQESSKQFKAEVNIEDETKSENNLVIGCEATLSSELNQYSDLDDIQLNVLKFNIRQHELSIVGTVDLKTLDGRQTTSDINKYSNFEVFYKTQKVGTLEVVDSEDKHYLYIVYKDKSRDNTSIYYDDFINDIETIFEK
jgi:hypothetical protein